MSAEPKSESCSHDGPIILDEQSSIVKPDPCIDKVCIDLMEKVYHGEFWLLPHFAQSLVTFLYSDAPKTDDPRVVVHHIATRGILVLQKVHEISEKERADSHLKITSEHHQHSRRIRHNGLRDCVALICGCSFVYDKFWIWFTGLFFLLNTSDVLTSQNRKIVVPLYIAVCATYYMLRIM